MVPFSKSYHCNAMIFNCYLTLETLKDFFLVSQRPLKTQWTQDFRESGLGIKDSVSDEKVCSLLEPLLQGLGGFISI